MDTPNPYFDERHLALRAEVRDFLHALPEEEVRRIHRGLGFSRNARKLAAGAGLAGLDVPQRHGGRGSDLVSVGIAYEELGRIDVDARELIGSGHGRLLALAGSEEARERWLPQIAAGELLVGIASTEERAGSDLDGLHTVIESWRNLLIVRGTKAYVSRILEADLFVVFGKRDQQLAAALVDMRDPDNRNRIRHETTPTMGMHGWSYGRNHFDDAIAVEALSFEGGGKRLFQAHFQPWRVLIALLCIGAASAAIDEAVLYVRGRRVGDRSLAEREDITLKLSGFYSRLQCVRLMAYQALWLMDRGHDATRESAIAKWHGISTAYDAVDGVLQLYGARGYTREFLHEKRFRDIRGLQIADGPTDVLRSVVGRDMIRHAVELVPAAAV